MQFSTLVDSQIEVSDVVAGRSNFGTAGLVGYHTKTSERVITIASPQDLITDFGFVRTDPTDAVWLAKVDQFFAQKPRPAALKIMRCENLLVQSYTITYADMVEGDTTKLTFDGTAIEVTWDGVTITTQDGVASAVADAINAIRTDFADVTGSVVTVAGVEDGDLFQFSHWDRFASVKSTSEDPDIADDLDSILAEDDDWIAIDLIDDGEDAVKAAAAWCESNVKLFVPTVCDTEARESDVDDDVGSDLTALALENTHAVWDGKSTSDARSLALFGTIAAFYNPGAATFAHKGLALTEADAKSTLRKGEQDALQAKNLNFYAPYRKVDTTWKGLTPAGGYFDISLGKLWLNDEIGARIFETIRGAPGKMGYTNESTDKLRSALKGTLETAADTDHNFLVPGSIEITLVKVENVDPSVRQGRLYSGMTWSARLQGAIDSAVLRGRVSF